MERGHKLHLDVAGGQIPISAVLTGANVNDVNVAIPLMKMTARPDFALRRHGLGLRCRCHPEGGGEHEPCGNRSALGRLPSTNFIAYPCEPLGA
jgi:hypothetical protein